MLVAQLYRVKQAQATSGPRMDPAMSDLHCDQLHHHRDHVLQTLQLSSLLSKHVRHSSFQSDRLQWWRCQPPHQISNGQLIFGRVFLQEGSHTNMAYSCHSVALLSQVALVCRLFLLLCTENHRRCCCLMTAILFSVYNRLVSSSRHTRLGYRSKSSNTPFW